MNFMNLHNYEDINPAKTPMAPDWVYDPQDPLSEDEATAFRSELMSCAYWNLCIRPDIAHTVGVLARYMSKPTASLKLALHRCFCRVNPPGSEKRARWIRYACSCPDLTWRCILAFASPWTLTCLTCALAKFHLVWLVPQADGNSKTTVERFNVFFLCFDHSTNCQSTICFTNFLVWTSTTLFSGPDHYKIHTRDFVLCRQASRLHYFYLFLMQAFRCLIV